MRHHITITVRINGMPEPSLLAHVVQEPAPPNPENKSHAFMLESMQMALPKTDEAQALVRQTMADLLRAIATAVEGVAMIPADNVRPIPGLLPS